MMIDLKEYQINEVIITENDIDEYLYLIKSGMVKVVKSIENKEIEVAFLKEGSFFGEMALIDDRPRTATVIAMEETVLEVFHRDSFIDIIHQNQNIAIKFLSGIFSRLRDANSKIDGSIMNENAKLISLKFLDNNNSFTDNEWQAIYKLSEDTFVEETESLKQSGAGAGLTDND